MSHTAADWPGTVTEAWARSAFRALTELSGVHRVGLALVEGGGRRLSFTASDRDLGSGTRWCSVDAYEDVPLNNTVRTGRVVVGSLVELTARYPEFAGRQGASTRALASVPLVAAGQILGGFVLFFETAQPFDDHQLTHLRSLGDALGRRLRRGRRVRTVSGRTLADEPVPAGARVADLAVSSEPHGVTVARHFAQDRLDAWAVDSDTADVAVLCLSELVTNAIIHTRPSCAVRMVLHDGVLSVRVRDGGTSVGQPVRPDDDPLAVHGRGLRLVEALSARWGSDLDAVGMTVWCEFAVS